MWIQVYNLSLYSAYYQYSQVCGSRFRMIQIYGMGTYRVDHERPNKKQPSKYP